MATRTFVKLNKRLKVSKSSNGTKFPQPNKCQQVRGAIINDATQFWIRTPVHLRSPLHFLQLSSHCINDTIYYASLEDLKNTKNDDLLVNKTSPSTICSPQPQQQQEVGDGNTATIPYSTNISIENKLGCTTPGTSNQCLYMNGQRYEVIASTSDLGSDMNSLNSASFQNIIINGNNTTLNGPIRLTSSDPPPLAFFPKAKFNMVKKSYASEPPPLVPIRHS